MRLDLARNLFSYISARYGCQGLSAIRLLSSQQIFQLAVEESNLICPEMLSEVKYIREVYNVGIQRFAVGDEIGVRVVTPTHGLEFRDDLFGTMVSALLRKLREKIPSMREFQASPGINLGLGVNVADSIANADMDRVFKAMQSVDPDTCARAQHYHDTMVSDPTAAYRLFNLIHDFYLEQRCELTLKREVSDEFEDFAAEGELQHVLVG